MKSKEIHIDSITGKKYSTISERVLCETLSPMMFVLYFLGTYRITYHSTTDGIISKDYLLCPRPGRPSYMYKIKWRYWNPLTIPLMILISAVFIIISFFIQGLSGASEMVKQLFQEFIRVKEQRA